MGANMARCLKDKGYNITAVQDHHVPLGESLAKELSCEAAASPARVAEISDIVLTVVTDDAAMDDIFSETSPSSLLTHAKNRLFINFATVDPKTHIKAEALVEAKGGTNLEALMASSITQAREGTLYLMCGGKKSVFEKAGPLLEVLSSKLLYRPCRSCRKGESARQYGHELQHRRVGRRVGIGRRARARPDNASRGLWPNRCGIARS